MRANHRVRVEDFSPAGRISRESCGCAASADDDWTGPRRSKFWSRSMASRHVGAMHAPQDWGVRCLKVVKVVKALRVVFLVSTAKGPSPGLQGTAPLSHRCHSTRNLCAIPPYNIRRVPLVGRRLRSRGARVSRKIPVLVFKPREPCPRRRSAPPGNDRVWCDGGSIALSGAQQEVIMRCRCWNVGRFILGSTSCPPTNLAHLQVEEAGA